MRSQDVRWHLKPQTVPPDWLMTALQERLPHQNGSFAAQLLWQRGIRDPETLWAFLEPERYLPTSPWAFGAEMEQAVARLQQAHEHQETVYIWGDFDADGITATAVLWEGLGQLLVPYQRLHYFIPNRLTASHGLSQSGIEAIAAQGGSLIVTCDTGSSDFAEIEQARQLGIDLIITDHHTLPPQRPEVVAFLNSRTFAAQHPLAHLSGVAVAYKLIEALHERLPHAFQSPPETLLDLVAIGLIADLVQLTGDCRYLAQQGLKRLKQQTQTPTRPGIAKLLELCKRTGDRPVDIAFGLGPRINALSRIHGDARDGVELLTTRDMDQAIALAESAEITNLCRKEVQQRVLREAEAALATLDLDTLSVIVLSDPQWPVGILGLVASHLAQTYGKPTVLLSAASHDSSASPQPLLRGSARSVRGIDLYELLAQQAHLLHRFGGHPFAAGLSLPPENLALFTASLNQTCRQRLGSDPTPALEIDLVVTLAEVVPEGGLRLFKELQQLEPFGMGNPVPRLLIQQCWLEHRRGKRSHTSGDRKVQYKRVHCTLRDTSTSTLFPGLWWEHEVEDLPQGCCDVVAELEYGQVDKTTQYYLRMVAVRPAIATPLPVSPSDAEPWLLDWRESPQQTLHSGSVLRLEHCPHQWEDLSRWAEQATPGQEKLALAYAPTALPTATIKWEQLAGFAKYAARTQGKIALQTLQEQLGLGARSLHLGLEALQALGFTLQAIEGTLTIQTLPQSSPPSDEGVAAQALHTFLQAVAEEEFQAQYFQKAPVEQLQQTLEQRLTRMDHRPYTGNVPIKC